MTTLAPGLVAREEAMGSASDVPSILSIARSFTESLAAMAARCILPLESLMLIVVALSMT